MLATAAFVNLLSGGSTSPRNFPILEWPNDPASSVSASVREGLASHLPARLNLAHNAPFGPLRAMRTSFRWQCENPHSFSVADSRAAEYYAYALYPRIRKERSLPQNRPFLMHRRILPELKNHQ